MKRINHVFGAFSEWASLKLGSSYAFILATLSVVVWGISGPFFQFNNSWQLYANTITTIVTFLMIFIIQNSQNRNALALHLKIDELILATKDAPDSAIHYEKMADDDLTAQHERLTAVMEQRQPQHKRPKHR